jgi:lysophospholipase L1-like esterase
VPYDYGVVGDSIAHDARRPLKNQLGGDGRIFARPGESIREQFDALRRFVATSTPDAPAFINLGTNDVFRGNRGARAIRQALDILGDRPINWVNVRTHGVNGFYGRDWRQRATAFNQRLAQIAGNRPNVNVIDWASESRGHRDWFRPDGLHPNANGSRAYAQYLSQYR